MILFIDGQQLSGKSTLISELCNNNSWESYRFPFDTYVNTFKLNDIKSINGFQIAKDLGILFALNACKPKNNIVFDRGPLSTIYYSLLTKRMNSEQIDEFFKELEKYPDFVYVFVKKSNFDNKIIGVREKNDGFDDIENIDFNYNQEIYKEMSINTIVDLAHKHKLRYFIFYNNFNLSPEENAERLKFALKGLDYEYIRSKNKSHN